MSDAPAPAANARQPRRAAQMLLQVGVWIGGLFLGAGTVDWRRGWIAVALYCAGMAGVGIVVRRANPGLMAERARWRRKDTKPFDKVFLSVMLPLACVQPAVAGMDAVRFRWWPISWPWLYPGAILFALSLALVAWTLAVNRHAESTVRIQTDRGHQVVTAGPYRTVRHPMYAGAILMYVATPLIWGSGAAMAVSGVIILLFVWRTYMEDRTLHRELAGYAEYASHTPYRLIPFLW